MEVMHLYQLRLTRVGTVLSQVVAVQRSFMISLIVQLDYIHAHKK